MGVLIMNKLEYWYARLSCRMDTDKRMSISSKLASLLRNDFSLMDALHRIEMIESENGKKPNEPFAIYMREVQKGLERGLSFSEATRGWVPPEETLLLMSGNLSDLLVSLENISTVVNGVNRIKRAVSSAFAYPLFLFAMTIGIIAMVGIYLVPPLTEAAGGDVVWRGTAASLIWVSDFMNKYLYIICAVVVVAIILIVVSLPIWTGKLRAKFDDFPPWSIYKLQLSVSWLMSLAAMVAADTSVPQAMRLLANNSNRYLSSILEETLLYITNGENLGNALAATGKNFPNAEIVGDLVIYSDMNDFSKNLNKIATEYMNESVRRIENLSSTLNSVGMALVSGAIGWVVFGTFQMQEQITAALT